MTWAIGGTIGGSLVSGGPAGPDTVAGCDVLATGHITNRVALRRTFGLGPAAGDTVIFAQAWRRWGADLPRHVLGEWAMALYDRTSGEALLAHDSVGTTALYHALASGGGIRFATHLTDLLADGTTPSLDEEYIADYLACGFIASARTPFRGIARLLPGTSLVFAKGRTRTVRHWSLAEAVPLTLSDADARERFRELLDEAAAGAVDGAAKVWAELSGGLDSSSVTSVAARLESPGLAAWSVYFPGHAFADERRFMETVVDAHGLDWHTLDASRHLPFAAPPADFIGEPTIGAVNGAMIAETRARQDADDVDVVLTGHGGDLVLGAFSGAVAAELADPLFVGDFAGAWRGMRAWRDGSAERRSHAFWLRYGVAAPAIQHLRGRAITTAAWLPLQPWIVPDYARRMALDARRRARLTERCRTPGRQRIADGIRVAALQMARDRQRQAKFRFRSPLLHRPLIDFMAALPFDQRTRPKCDRYLQRHALAGILPDPVRRRASKGIATPSFAEGLSRAPDWVDWLTSDSRLVRIGIADAAGWTQAIRQASVGQTHGDQFLHAGVALEIWLRQLER